MRQRIYCLREAFPATIADPYDPKDAKENPRPAHDNNDEVFERIYIGRRLKNTERLEKLFELYAKMTTAPTAL